MGPPLERSAVEAGPSGGCLQVQQSEHIQLVTRLEQWLMEGAYNKVLDARERAASDYFKHFLDQLSSTVR